MIDDIKDVVPEEYWKKHLATKMRQTPFATILDGKGFTFHVLCKVDACLSPRDSSKLKENIIAYTQELAKDPRIFASEVLEKLMAAVYEKQVDGMGNDTDV